MSSKKKLIVSLSAVCLVAVIAVVAVVAVLAAGQQSITSNVNVTYRATGIAAKASANYYNVATNATELGAASAFTAAGGAGVENGVITFSPTGTTTGTLSPAGEITLSAAKPVVIFEFKFENLSQSRDIALGLTLPATQTNVTVSYYVAEEAITNPADVEFASAETITVTDLAKKADADTASYKYVYVKAQVADLTTDADFDGDFAWTLDPATLPEA